jgi:hypothetical protein
MKAKTTDRGKEQRDGFAERIIGVLNEAGDVAQKRFEDQLEHGRKATFGVHARESGKKGGKA